MKKGKKIYEGKAKIIFATNDKNTVIQHFKDDATAFNNQKKARIEGKGILNNRISEHILSSLSEIGIIEQTEDQALNQIPNMSFLQRKKLAQLAGEEYNLHIRTRIKPKFGSSSPNLFVRILLKINDAGEIVFHEIKESSGSKAFDKTAELAVRNAVLDPLPKALAENPPYIVVIKLRQN